MNKNTYDEILAAIDSDYFMDKAMNGPRSVSECRLIMKVLLVITKNIEKIQERSSDIYSYLFEQKKIFKYDIDSLLQRKDLKKIMRLVERLRVRNNGEIPILSYYWLRQYLIARDSPFAQCKLFREDYWIGTMIYILMGLLK